MKYFVVATLLVLNAACVGMLVPKIERSIQHGAEQAVAQFDWASVTVTGRTVLVGGSAPLSERAFAARRLRGVTLAAGIIFTDQPFPPEDH